MRRRLDAGSLNQKLIPRFCFSICEMAIQISEMNDGCLAGLADLLNAEYKNSYDFIPYDENRILSEIRRRSMRVFIASRGSEIIGLIAIHSHGEENEEHISWLAARHEDDQLEIENMLIKTVQQDSKDQTIIAMVEEGSPRIKDWLDRGYVLCPGFERMSARLDGPKVVPEVAEGIKLRSLKNGEEQKLIEAMNAGFGWNRLEEGIVDIWKAEDPPFTEEWVQVAESADRIVSAVVAKPDTEYSRFLHSRRGYLGPAATIPEFRNKHLASALTARAMNFLLEKGMVSVRLGTSELNVSSNALLRGLGFKVDVIHKILRKDKSAS